MDMQELIAQREEKLAALRKEGFSGYDKASAGKGRGSVPDALVSPEGSRVCICGRVTAKRSHGKVSFVDLRDAGGRIQLYLRSDAFDGKDLVLLGQFDIGDILEVCGEIFKTHSGEITVKVDKMSMLSKALRPLPEKWHGLKDVELVEFRIGATGAGQTVGDVEGTGVFRVSAVTRDGVSFLPASSTALREGDMLWGAVLQASYARIERMLGAD